MNTTTKKAAFVALVALLTLGAGPQHRTYDQNSWYVDTEPETKSMAVQWERIFPVEGDGTDEVLHVPDSFVHLGRTIEIVQGDEVEDFDIRKQVAASRLSGTGYAETLRRLHMKGADMCLDEIYTAGNAKYAMDGYSIEIREYKDGQFGATITIYTRKPKSTTEK
jgi:hypothetical protein